MQVATLGDNVYQLTMCTDCEELIYTKNGDLDTISELFQKHLTENVRCRKNHDERQKKRPTFKDIIGILN